MIPNIVAPDDLRESKLAVLNASYFKSFWNKPFEEEVVAHFETVRGPRPITYLKGDIVGKYKKDDSGEVGSIPLKDEGQFVVFKPKEGRRLRLFDSSMLIGLSKTNLSLMLPKVSIESNTNLQESLDVCGFSGLRQAFYNKELQLGRFFQRASLRTTLKGVEGGAATWADMLYSTGIKISIDHPYSVAIVIPASDGTYLPLLMGYVGDPTLS